MSARPRAGHRHALRGTRQRPGGPHRRGPVPETGAVTAAVRASVRHLDTGYDALLTAGTARKEARARVSAAIETVLASWRHPPGR
ncbi:MULTISPECIES: DUF2293 domain-containing protein [Streptomyces]|uniref:DUF2293 domain-containing protein n=1 Tax=Streptomyces achmelvichensis TaxID=3134111 RepID=A0ACC6PS78_9ACTN|nr:DUF2293 domain-containing protein [Streptomyces sp. NBC_01167]